MSKTKAGKQASERSNERVRAGKKREKKNTEHELKKKIKKNNNKVSSPFGCNRCFCTAIYLLSCMYRVISCFTSCVSVVPPYRHLSRRASIYYFPSDLALLLLLLPLLELMLLFRFLFQPPPPLPPPLPLLLLLFFP